MSASVADFYLVEDEWVRGIGRETAVLPTKGRREVPQAAAAPFTPLPYPTVAPPRFQAMAHRFELYLEGRVRTYPSAPDSFISSKMRWYTAVRVPRSI